MPTFKEMNQLLKENGIKYSMIIDKLQLQAQGTESSQKETPSTQNSAYSAPNKPTHHHTPTKNKSHHTTMERTKCRNRHTWRRRTTPRNILLPGQIKIKCPTRKKTTKQPGNKTLEHVNQE